MCQVAGNIQERSEEEEEGEDKGVLLDCWLFNSHWLSEKVTGSCQSLAFVMLNHWYACSQKKKNTPQKTHEDNGIQAAALVGDLVSSWTDSLSGTFELKCQQYQLMPCSALALVNSSSTVL